MATTLAPDRAAEAERRLNEAEPSDLESRAGIRALDVLHAQRRQLMVMLAPLKALHGPFGIWDARRKQLLESLKVRARSALIAQGVKTTETMIDAEAHGDAQYLAFLDQSERDKIEYLHMQTELDEIEEAIRSREIELLAYNSEVKLSR